METKNSREPLLPRSHTRQHSRKVSFDKEGFQSHSSSSFANRLSMARDSKFTKRRSMLTKGGDPNNENGEIVTTIDRSQFNADWLSNLFDEDNLRCSRGDYSRSLSDLYDLGGLKALETYLYTN